MKFFLASLFAVFALYLGISALAQPERTSSSPAVRNGQRLYTQSCASCHDARSTVVRIGPGLKSYYSAHSPRPTDANVRAVIAKGKGTMPGFNNLSQEQMNDLIVYLKTL
jgi:mono/diheme cytochrome c family protein